MMIRYLIFSRSLVKEFIRDIYLPSHSPVYRLIFKMELEMERKEFNNEFV